MEDQRPISLSLLVTNFVLIILVILMVFVVYNKLQNTGVRVDGHGGQVVDAKTFPPVHIQAKAAYVYDVVGKRMLYGKNETVQLPLASLTKLMTALTARDLLPKDSKIAIRSEFLAPEGDSGLIPGENWTLKNLLDFSLVTSSNDGARSIAAVIGAVTSNTSDLEMGRKEFVQKMNEEARKLLLTQTYFVNESGLDESSTQSGGYGSAKDVATLLGHIIETYPDLLEATTYDRTNIASSEKSHYAQNTNVDVNDIPALIASKTGYTALAGGNLAIAFDSSIGRPIIVVVLGSTTDGRFTDVNTLVRAALNYVK